MSGFASVGPPLSPLPSTTRQSAEELSKVVGPACLVEAAEAPRVLDRPKQREVVVGYRRSVAGKRPGRDDDRGDPSATAEARRTLIPGDDQQAVRERGAARDPRDERAEEGVALGDRAVVHVVRHVRNDQLEVRGDRAERREAGGLPATTTYPQGGESARRLVLAE